MRGERERGEQQKSVGKMQREVWRAQRGLALRRESQLDQERAENGFNEGEQDGGN